MNRRSLFIIVLAGCLILSAGITLGFQLYDYSISREQQEMCGSCEHPEKEVMPVKCDESGVNSLLQISIEAGKSVLKAVQE